jgi:hypothetical protein
LAIKNYKKPYSHFSSPIRSITKEDFETISNELIFISRTAFANFVNSFQISSKLNFSQSLLSELNKTQSSGINYVEAYDSLIKYIDREFLILGELLISSRDQLIQNFTNLFDIDRIGFYEENPYTPMSITNQAKRFEQLIAIWRQDDGVNEINIQIEQNIDSEKRFNEVFKSVPWPINFEA